MSETPQDSTTNRGNSGAFSARSSTDSGATPAPQDEKPRVRIALLLDELPQPAWVARAISELVASSAVHLALVVLNDSPPPPQIRFARIRSWVRNRQHLLFALYQKFDRWWFGAEDDDPFTVVDISAALRGVPAIRVVPRMTKHCDYFQPGDVDEIRRHDIDVAIRFGFRILKGDALRIARHGVWSYHHGDNLVNRGGPPGFWEVMEGARVTGSVLQRLTEDLDDGQVLYRAFSSTNKFSVTKNQAGYYWTSARLLRRVVEDLYRNGADVLFARQDISPGWHGYSHRLYGAPKNAEMAKLMLRVARRYVVEKLSSLSSFEQWFVAYRLRRQIPPDRFTPDTSYYRFTKLIPPPDRFWADPFPVEFDGRHYIFVEEFFYQTQLGRIALFEIDKTGVAQGPVPVLERAYHLSYPFVFEWEGAHYMIPETHASGQIELFRAADFPHNWVFDRVLVADIRAVDATLAYMDGRWWMFASAAPPPEIAWDELYIFYAESPLGPWTPHGRNPVKSDARSARPAGRLFRWNDKYYRPAQDCSERYGHSIVIHEVVRITPDEFVEVEVSRITPDWTDRLLATHTINADGALAVIDGLQLRRRGSR